MSAPRVLLANEPLSYRDALVAVLGSLRPLAEVWAVEAAALERETRRLAPHLVVCSRLVPAVEEVGVAAWVELYPDHGALSRVCVRGEHRTVGDMQLRDLLCLVDEAQRISADQHVLSACMSAGRPH